MMPRSLAHPTDFDYWHAVKARLPSTVALLVAWLFLMVLTVSWSPPAPAAKQPAAQPGTSSWDLPNGAEHFGRFMQQQETTLTTSTN